MRISDWSSDVCSSDLQAAAADRIVVQVFGADRLIAIAADRAAATRVESARRRDVEKRRAADLAEAQTSGEDIVVRPERHIGAAVDLAFDIPRLAGLKRQIRRNARDTAKAQLRNGAVLRNVIRTGGGDGG